MKSELGVHELRPAWSRLMLCRYILRLKARIRELEAENTRQYNRIGDLEGRDWQTKTYPDLTEEIRANDQGTRGGVG